VIGLPVKPVHWMVPLEVALKLTVVAVHVNTDGVLIDNVGLVRS
jgi:hypothetical protein